MKVISFLLFFLQSTAFASDLELALNWKPEPEFGGFYLANLKGLDAKKGIQLKIVPGGAGQPVAQMLANGKVPLGIVSADEVLMARDRGADLVAIFAVYQTSPVGLMTHEEKGFKSLEDFFKSDSTLAIQKGMPAAVFMERKYGYGKVKVVPYQGGVGGFIRDKNFAQQCFVTSEPLLAKKQGAKPKTFLVSESGFDPYVEVVAAKGEFVRKNPKLIQDLVEIFQAGWAAYQEDFEETNKVMNGLNPAMTLEVFNESAKVQKPFVQPVGSKIGTMKLERWQKFADQLFEMKLISKKAKAQEAFVSKF
ncbi:MAG: ABC transporter substrate-binding protein [Bdellovibrionales bacterium]|nr:ABC transporter substrate-binding protein [Bdellovibrionales bacterium]